MTRRRTGATKVVVTRKRPLAAAISVTDERIKLRERRR